MDSVPGTPPPTTPPTTPLPTTPLPTTPLPTTPLPTSTDPDEVIPETPLSHCGQSGILQHSTAASNLLGTRVPKNTQRINEGSLRALARFLTSKEGFLDKIIRTEREMRAYDMWSKPFKDTWELMEARKLLFSDGKGGVLPVGHGDWKVEQFKNLRYYLIEFVVNYKTAKGNKDVKPTTMKTYLLGLQRAFVISWGYKVNILSGEILNCPRDGLMAVIDNKFSLQQSKGVCVESHNVLGRTDLETLYRSKWLSRDTPQGFQARLVFDVAFVTSMRPTELQTLTTSQFTKTVVNGEQVWKIRGIVGSKVGASKTRGGGWKAVHDKPHEISVWDRPSLGGILNVFKDIDDYMRIRIDMCCGSDRFFLGINRRGKELKDFFKCQHMGKNTFNRIIKETCQAEGITGVGSKRGISAHSLRGTVCTMLSEDGHADSAIALRTGHRDLGSLKNYQNLDSRIGAQQQDDIFRGSTKRKQQEVVSASPGCNKENGGQEPDNGDVKKHMRLLSEVQNISGVTFTINVNNHYR